MTEIRRKKKSCDPLNVSTIVAENKEVGITNVNEVVSVNVVPNGNSGNKNNNMIKKDVKMEIKTRVFFQLLIY